MVELFQFRKRPQFVIANRHVILPFCEVLVATNVRILLKFGHLSVPFEAVFTDRCRWGSDIAMRISMGPVQTSEYVPKDRLLEAGGLYHFTSLVTERTNRVASPKMSWVNDGVASGCSSL